MTSTSMKQSTKRWNNLYRIGKTTGTQQNDDVNNKIMCKHCLASFWHMAAYGDDTYALRWHTGSDFCCVVVRMVGVGYVPIR